MDVVVAGGGIAGMALVHACRARGIGARAYERAPSPTTAGGALVMWSNAVHVLDRLGLGDRVLEAGTPIEEAVFRDRAGASLMTVPVGAVGRRLGAPTVVLPRRALFRLLLDALEPGAVVYGRQCVDVSVSPEAATLSLSATPVEATGPSPSPPGDSTVSDEVVGSIAVGADGLSSQVRRFVRGADAPRSALQTAWIGIAPLVDPSMPAGLMVGSLGHAQRFWGTRIGRGATYWYAIVSDEGAGPTVRRKRELVDAFAGWHAPVRDLIESTPEDEILVTPVRDRFPRGPWHRGRVTLCGDAAHPLTPDLGQGACQALESALVLADVVASRGPDAAALAEYGRLRSRRTEALVHLSWSIARRSMTRSTVESAVRDLVLRATPSVVTGKELEWILAGPPGFPAIPASAHGAAWPA